MLIKLIKVTWVDLDIIIVNRLEIDLIMSDRFKLNTTI